MHINTNQLIPAPAHTYVVTYDNYDSEEYIFVEQVFAFQYDDQENLTVPLVTSADGVCLGTYNEDGCPFILLTSQRISQIVEQYSRLRFEKKAMRDIFQSQRANDPGNEEYFLTFWNTLLKQLSLGTFPVADDET